jgi:hypothetical protein
MGRGRPGHSTTKPYGMRPLTATPPPSPSSTHGNKRNRRRTVRPRRRYCEERSFPRFWTASVATRIRLDELIWSTEACLLLQAVMMLEGSETRSPDAGRRARKYRVRPSPTYVRLQSIY